MRVASTGMSVKRRLKQVERARFDAFHFLGE
jgi:hypothetical protein